MPRYQMQLGVSTTLVKGGNPKMQKHKQDKKFTEPPKKILTAQTELQQVLNDNKIERLAELLENPEKDSMVGGKIAKGELTVKQYLHLPYKSNMPTTCHPWHMLVRLEEEEGGIKCFHLFILYERIIFGAEYSPPLDEHGNTVLHIACYVGNTDVAKLVTTFFPLVHLLGNKYGSLPLHYAAQKEHWKLFEIVFWQLCSKNRRDEILAKLFAQQDQLGNTIWHYLINSPILTQLEKLSLLEICCASLPEEIFKLTVNKNKQSVLNITIEKELPDCFALLLPLFKLTDKEIEALLQVISSKKNLALLDALMETKPLQIDPNMLLFSLVRVQNTKRLETLLAGNLLKINPKFQLDINNIDDPKAPGLTALHIAAMNGWTEIAIILVNFGALLEIIAQTEEDNDPNNDQNAFQLALIHQHSQTAIFLMRHTNPNLNHSDPKLQDALRSEIMQQTIGNRSLELLKEVQQHFAGCYDEGPLYWIIRCWEVKEAAPLFEKALKEPNLDLKKTDDRGRTALFCAINCRVPIEVTKKLILAGANLGCKDNTTGNTFMHVVLLIDPRLCLELLNFLFEFLSKKNPPLQLDLAAKNKDGCSVYTFLSKVSRDVDNSSRIILEKCRDILYKLPLKESELPSVEKQLEFINAKDPKDIREKKPKSKKNKQKKKKELPSENANLKGNSDSFEGNKTKEEPLKEKKPSTTNPNVKDKKPTIQPPAKKEESNTKKEPSIPKETTQSDSPKATSQSQNITEAKIPIVGPSPQKAKPSNVPQKNEKKKNNDNENQPVKPSNSQKKNKQPNPKTPQKKPKNSSPNNSSKNPQTESTLNQTVTKIKNSKGEDTTPQQIIKDSKMLSNDRIETTEKKDTIEIKDGSASQKNQPSKPSEKYGNKELHKNNQKSNADGIKIATDFNTNSQEQLVFKKEQQLANTPTGTNNLELPKGKQNKKKKQNLDFSKDAKPNNQAENNPPSQKGGPAFFSKQETPKESKSEENPYQRIKPQKEEIPDEVEVDLSKLDPNKLEEKPFSQLCKFNLDCFSEKKRPETWHTMRDLKRENKFITILFGGKIIYSVINPDIESQGFSITLVVAIPKDTITNNSANPLNLSPKQWKTVPEGNNEFLQATINGEKINICVIIYDSKNTSLLKVLQNRYIEKQCPTLEGMLIDLDKKYMLASQTTWWHASTCCISAGPDSQAVFKKDLLKMLLILATYLELYSFGFGIDEATNNALYIGSPSCADLNIFNTLKTPKAYYSLHQSLVRLFSKAAFPDVVGLLAHYNWLQSLALDNKNLRLLLQGFKNAGISPASDTTFCVSQTGVFSVLSKLESLLKYITNGLDNIANGHYDGPNGRLNFYVINPITHEQKSPLSFLLEAMPDTIPLALLAGAAVPPVYMPKITSIIPVPIQIEATKKPYSPFKISNNQYTSWQPEPNSFKKTPIPKTEALQPPPQKDQQIWQKKN